MVSSSIKHQISAIKLITLTTLAMLAFASNSVLCRIALKHTSIDAASFTAIRLISGAVVLCIITAFFRRGSEGKGNWVSAFALFTYAAGFSFAYISLTAATGALLLFGAVQATMIAYGLFTGERLHKQQLFGLALAFGGLVGLLLPGLADPPLVGSVIMLIAGVAWGIYSIRGKNAGDPTHITTGNFLRASVFTVILSVIFINKSQLDMVGVGYAIASGALASGFGYALWYAVLPALKSTNAATVQLSVPVIAAFGGIVLLDEAITLRFALSSIAILIGIACVIIHQSKTNES